ncbi:MAG TPA: hypothetical protein VKD71_14850 [Gemmataceae bacterium]|nr:hypothetical protein [Gemmataceae bacterium]
MFTVDWIQSTLDELARIWLTLDSAGRRAITEAAAQIDRELTDSADVVGESRFGTLRVHYVEPLGLTFSVDVEKRTAHVVNVWLVR